MVIEKSKNNREILVDYIVEIIDKLDLEFISKAMRIIYHIPEMCKLNKISSDNRKNRQNKLHPIRPNRGDIYNAFIEENIGSELRDSHLVVIMQNKKGNLYGEKVNILPIEGDGEKFNPNYQIQLTNDDLLFGKLDKNPSRIIITDITTFDKARLDKNPIGRIKPEKMIIVSEMLKKQLEIF